MNDIPKSEIEQSLDAFVMIRKLHKEGGRKPPTREEWAQLALVEVTERDRNLMEQAKLFGWAAKGREFPAGRPEGAKSPQTCHIEKLVTDNPSLSAKEIRAKADNNIIGNMSEGTFGNQVSMARNPKK